jgi:hypothetical protein
MLAARGRITIFRGMYWREKGRKQQWLRDAA